MSKTGTMDITKTLQIDEIFKRIRHIEPSIDKSDAAIARALGASPSGPGRWRERPSIPYENLFTFAERHSLNFIWLLTGKGETYVGQASDSDVDTIAKSIAEYDVNDTSSLLMSAMKLFAIAKERLEKAGIDNGLQLIGQVEKAFEAAGETANDETRAEVLQFYALALKQDLPDRMLWEMLVQECVRVGRMYLRWSQKKHD